MHSGKDGMMWMQIRGWLVAFDGNDEHWFPPSDSTRIDPGVPYAIETGPEGNIWLAMNDGAIGHMNGFGGRVDRWGVAPDDPNGLTSASVSDLFIDSGSRLWVATESGLNRFDDSTGAFVHFTHDPDDPASLPSEYVGSVAEDGLGSIWIGTDKGLARLDETTGVFELFHFDLGAEYSYVKSILIDAEDRFWIVVVASPGDTFGLLVGFDPSSESFETYEFADGEGAVAVSALVRDRQGHFWAATEKGIAEFFPENATFQMTRLIYESGEISGQSSFSSLALDRGGGLWAAGFRLILRLETGQPGFWSYSTLRGTGKSRMLTGWVDAAIASRDGETLWFSTGFESGTPPLGLTKLDRSTGKETYYRHDPEDPTSISDNYVLDLVERSDGKIWVAGPNGLSLLDPETHASERFYIDGDQIADWTAQASRGANWINKIWPASDSELWLATASQGAVFADIATGLKRSYAVDPPTSDERPAVSDIRMSEDGIVWMIVGGQVARMDPDTGETGFIELNPSASGAYQATSIYQDDVGRIWVGTKGAGLNVLDPETKAARRFGRLHGLPWTGIHCIVANDNSIWARSFFGISRFDSDEENFENFWIGQGSFVTPASCSVAPTGELVFPGEKGFIVVKPDSVRAHQETPEIVLTSVRVSGVELRPGLDERLPKPLKVADVVELTHIENSIVFEYAGIDFGHQTGRRYEYRLFPVETEWQDAETRTSVSYSRLDPDEYTFQVRIIVAGLESPLPASFQFVISPPWWGTWWARGLYGIAFIVLIVGGYTYRVRRLEEYSERLEVEVSERTRDLEEEKRRTEEIAHRLVELDEAKNRFFANISHEFRTPLTLIIGPLQDVLEGGLDDDPSQLRRHHEVMLANGRRVLRLVNQLLDLSKIESGKLDVVAQPADLVTFLRSLAARLAPAADRRQIDLTFHPEVESLPVEFDDDKVEKIVTNLASNALKFTPPGGKVALSVGTRHDDESDIAEVSITVSDTGRGIASHDLEYIFDRFHQVDDSTTRSFEGTGIGLSLVRELTELMGGSVAVESKLGFGSSFEVNLPLRLVDAEAISRARTGQPNSTEWIEPVGQDSFEDENELSQDIGDTRAVILVVEDNAEIREYIRSLLAADYRIISAENGKAGLDLAQEVRPDLILADVMMPQMDGYEMVKRLRNLAGLRHTPIVLLTARAEESETVEGIEAGADDYISKPFSPRELEARITALISRRREMRREFSEEVVVQGTNIVVKPVDARFLEQVVEVIESRLDDVGFGPDWLADEVGFGRRQLERKLLAVTGESPASLIRRLRLERASKLLRAGAGTVAEIAYSVGFKNPAYFSRAFRKAFGESPSEHAERQ